MISMPHGWPNIEWIKPLKRSEKAALEKYLVKEGYDIKTIKNMNVYQQKKLWKTYKEHKSSMVNKNITVKKTLKEFLYFWR